MSGIPYSSRIAFTLVKYSLGGVMKPPTPWIGSAIIAATSPEVVVSITLRTSSAHATPQLGYSRRSGQR